MGTSTGTLDLPPSKVALVTGAGSGIGAAVAEVLAEEGLGIALLGRTLSELQEVSDRLEKKGAKTLILTVDVSDAAAMSGAFQEIQARWGRLDVVVANAGINGVWAPLEDLSPEEWDLAFAINARGTFLTLHHAIPALRLQGGSIVIVASINGSRVFGNLGASAYAASKAAQVALAKMAARELAGFGIRVNVVCPGSISTQIEDSMERRNLECLGRKASHGIPLTKDEPGTPRQVAELVGFLASDQAAHITGTEVFIDGGESLFGG